MRTLTFGDRTISYDTGLDILNTENNGDAQKRSFQSARFAPAERKVSVAYSDDSGAGSECSEDQEDVETERKLIKPDMMALSQLLNFDEEEEDNMTDNDADDSDDESKKSNIKWHKAIVKDLVNLKPSDTVLKRRHSVTSLGSTMAVSSTAAAAPRPGSHMTSLNLSLSEVGHIRSVLVRAELEASSLEPAVKQSIEQGKMCIVCTSSRFGMFRRGEKCEMCQQIICFKCFSRMRIPAEQFSAIPVQVLSPTTDNKDSSSTKSMLSTPHMSNCAGSAPNSPKNKKKEPLVSLSAKHLLHEQINSLPTISDSPLSPPRVTSRYSTLPKTGGRRWSMLYSREKDREKLEGSLLIVCIPCSDMVKQVIRAWGQTRRLSTVRKKV